MKSLIKPTLLLFLTAFLESDATARTFTSANGQEIEAEITFVSGGKVTLERSDGRVFSVAPEMFSQEDQAYISKWKEDNKGKVPPHLKDQQPRMTIDVSTGKTHKDDDLPNGYIDEKKQKVRIKAKLESSDPIYPIIDAKLTAMVLGRSPITRDTAVVYKQVFKGIELPLSEVKEYECKGFELWYDDRGAMYGHKFRGYIVYLEDPQGKILHAKCIPGAAENYMENVKKLKAGDVINNRYEKKGTTSLKKSVLNVR